MHLLAWQKVITYSVKLKIPDANSLANLFTENSKLTKSSTNGIHKMISFHSFFFRSEWLEFSISCAIPNICQVFMQRLCILCIILISANVKCSRSDCQANITNFFSVTNILRHKIWLSSSIETSFVVNASPFGMLLWCGTEIHTFEKQHMLLLNKCSLSLSLLTKRREKTQQRHIRAKCTDRRCITVSEIDFTDIRILRKRKC